MKNRPISAYPLATSQSSKTIKWSSKRPSTAVIQISNTLSTKVLDINVSTDSSHAVLPKETLGSRLVSKLPRPASAIIKTKPTFKVNTLTLSKEFQSFSNNKKQERVDLIQKLKRLCNTRSAQLLENSLREEINQYEKIESPQNSLVSEVRKIWENLNFPEHGTEKSEISQNFEAKKARPFSAISKSKTIPRLNQIYVPGIDGKNESISILSAIPENKQFENMPDKNFQVNRDDIYMYKKPCDIKVFSINIRPEKKLMNGFRGKLVRKKSKSKFSRTLKV